MSLLAKIVFGFFIVALFNAPVLAFQEQEADLAWYRQFFKDTVRPSAEQELQQAQTALDDATITSDNKARVKALMEIGLIHLTRTHDYDKAMDYFIRSLTIEDSVGLKREQVFTFIAMAQMFEEVGDFDESASFLEQAEQANEKENNIPVLVFILNKLCKIQIVTGKIEQAFENYRLVLGYKDKVDDADVESEAMFNIAHLYTIQGKYNEALEEHKKVLALRRAANDKSAESQSLNDIAELYHVMKNKDKAIANHSVALKIRIALKDRKALSESYNNIGVLHYEDKNYQRAVSNLLLGLDAGQDAQDQMQMSRSYDFLSQSYKELGDFKNALKYQELRQAIHEFIQNDRNERRLVATRNRYDLGKKESQIDKLEIDRVQREKEIEAQKKFEKVLIALVATVLVIIALVLYLYILKRRSNRELQRVNEQVRLQNIQLQQLNATKDKFFSILGHDLKGPLNSLTSFSGLLINHTDSLSKDEIRMLAQDLDKSLKNLFALLENLLEWSRSQTGNIEFKPEVFDLATVLEMNKDLLNTQASNKKITLDNTCRVEVNVNAHRHSINTVIRNLISNAIKFTPEGGTVTLSAQRGNDEVMVSVSDSGVGMTPEVIGKLFRIDTKLSTKGTADEKGTGLGLILCKEFIEKNGGHLGVKSEPEKGSVFYFTIPVRA